MPSMNRSWPDQVAWTMALLLSGVAAGMFLMDFFGYYPVLRRLPDPAALELHQQSLPGRRLIFRVATGSSGLAGIVLLIFFSEGIARRLLVVHLLCLVALILYTNWALVPLNREIATWSPAAPPLGWKHSFSKMIDREQFRGFLPALAFALEFIALVVRWGPSPAALVERGSDA
jgi:hypothetical protein